MISQSRQLFCLMQLIITFFFFFTFIREKYFSLPLFLHPNYEFVGLQRFIIIIIIQSVVLYILESFNLIWTKTIIEFSLSNTVLEKMVLFADPYVQYCILLVRNALKTQWVKNGAIIMKNELDKKWYSISLLHVSSHIKQNRKADSSSP